MNKEMEKHIIKSIAADKRLDGRKRDEYRPIKIEYGISENAEGSAKVEIGGTIVLAGVKLSLETPYSDTPDQGNLMISVELKPLASPEFEGGPPGIDAIELARVTDRGIREGGAIDTKSLCVVPGEKVWMVSIDIVPINDEGNLYDAASIAAIAALKDTHFPKYDGEKLDYHEHTKEKIQLLKEPIGITVRKVGDYTIVDPTNEEEKAVQTRLTVTTTKEGRICAMQKGGEETPLTIDEVDKMVEFAIKKSKEIRKYL